MISELECLIDSILEYRPEIFKNNYLVTKFAPDGKWNYQKLLTGSPDDLYNLYKILNESNYYS